MGSPLGIGARASRPLLVALKDVYRRGDITHQDYVELWRRIREV
jgi:hypothetical protein